MLLVKGENITFNYESQIQELHSGINFRIDSCSRIGIVGKNGCGKSTLLKIILGVLNPTTGFLQKTAKLKIGYLQQILNTVDTITVTDFINQTNPHLLESEIRKNLKKVGLEPSLLDQNIKRLSGGEKTKVGLLNVLLTDPDLLILDEPTNNLDLKAIFWLKSFLLHTKLPFVIVSHDRTILEDCTSEIWEIENGHLTQYSGNYNFYKQFKEKKYHADLEKHEHQKDKIKRLETAASKRRIDANRMENFKPTRSVKKKGGLCKSDEGSGSSSANPTKKMRAAKALEKRVQLTIEREEAKIPWLDKKRKIILPLASICSNETVLSVKNLSFSIENKSILNEIDFSLKTGEKLAIVGANGSGKSTLINILSGELVQSKGTFKWANSATISTFYQSHVELASKKTILQTVWLPELIEEHFARTVLGSLGIAASLVTQSLEKLSPGEKIKTSLAKAVLSGANTLILDEPTNHLEVSAREMLEQALEDYKGTVIFVSHDLSFIEKVATRIFDLSINRMFFSIQVWQEANSTSEAFNN